MRNLDIKMMRIILFLLVLIVGFSCKEENASEKIELSEKSNSSEQFKTSSFIDFEKEPLELNEIKLNLAFDLTSSMIDLKYTDDLFCNYNDYHLVRNYFIIDKYNVDFKRNLLRVFVKDDSNKWIRDKATEEFYSIEVFDKSIILWNSFYVGMEKDEIFKIIDKEKLRIENDELLVQSSKFQIKFILKDNSIHQMKVVRKCNE